MFDKLFNRKSVSHSKTDITKRFNLIGRVGQGSMSKVWRATDLQSGRPVALKILDKEKTAKYEARFLGLNKPCEGEVALSLHHPNIVKTYEFGWTLEDEMFLVMEFVEGVGLALLVDLQNEEMKRYRLRYMIQIGEALNHFHSQALDSSRHLPTERDDCGRQVCQNDRLRASGSQHCDVLQAGKPYGNCQLYGSGIDQTSDDGPATRHFFLCRHLF